MYKCIQKVNTNMGSFEVGDIVSEVVAKEYSRFFEKVDSQKELLIDESSDIQDTQDTVEVDLDNLDDTQEVEGDSQKDDIEE